MSGVGGFWKVLKIENWITEWKVSHFPAWYKGSVQKVKIILFWPNWPIDTRQYLSTFQTNWSSATYKIENSYTGCPKKTLLSKIVTLILKKRFFGTPGTSINSYFYKITLLDFLSSFPKLVFSPLLFLFYHLVILIKIIIHLLQLCWCENPSQFGYNL